MMPDTREPRLPPPPPPEPGLVTVPPGKDPWWKQHKVTSGVIAGVFVLLAVAGLSSLAGTGGTPAPAVKTTTQPAPAVTQPAAPAATTPPSAGDQILAWFNGGGSTELNAISGDMNQLSSDANASMAAGTILPALTADAGQLVTDSQALLNDMPPPVVPAMNRHLRAGLLAFIAAGQDIQGGLIVSATEHLKIGSTEIALATAAIKQATG